MKKKIIFWGIFILFSFTLFWVIDITDTQAEGENNNQKTTDSIVDLSTTYNQTYLPDSIKLYANDGYLWIKTPQRLPLWIFSSAGNLILMQYITPGEQVSIPITPPGMYIVKIGGLTRKLWVN